MYIDDTIAAIATTPGIGGGGSIRVCGQDRFSFFNNLFTRDGQDSLLERSKKKDH